MDEMCPRSALAAFALDEFEPKSSPGSRAKSMLQDTYGSLKRHTAMMEHHAWKRDFVLMQATSASGKLKRGSSKEDLLLLKAGTSSDAVELTSVRSKVKETVQALETKYGTPGDSAGSPIYSTINRANKKNKRTAEGDISGGPNDPAGQPAISLSALKLPIEEEVADISEISQLLTNTNELLNRSSHLRASLTVSVRHPNKKTAQTTTFLFPAKKKEGGKKPKAKKQGLWNNLLRKSREDLSVDSDVENSSSDSSVEPPPEKCVSKYEEANARVAAKLEKTREQTELAFKLGAAAADAASSSDDSGNKDDLEDSAEDERMEEAEARPFVRHNPARRPLGPGATVDIRRSIRLAPKTVANLASKFDSLLVSDDVKCVSAPPVSSASTEPTKTVLPEKELKLCKKDISKIIETLNKLEDDAKKGSAGPAKASAASTGAKPRATVVTSSRFTTSAIGRKSLRMKHGGALSLAAKTGKVGSELSKKNSLRRPHQPLGKEVELKTVDIETDTPPEPEGPPEMKKAEVRVEPPSKPQTRAPAALPLPKYLGKDEITSKMESAKSLLASVELPSDTAQMNKSLSLTDRYLKKLAILAGTEEPAGARFSQPPAAIKAEHVNAVIHPSHVSSDIADGYEDVAAKSLHYLDLDGYGDSRKGASHAYADLTSSRASVCTAYDDVNPPSEHTHVDHKGDPTHALRRSASEDNLSLRYDPVDVSILVTARPAIVREDQLDSLSYVYDDVGGNSFYGGADGPGLYESIAGSILNLARNKMGFDAASVENLYASLTKNASAEAGGKSGHSDEDSDSLATSGPHEVLSYTLAKWSQAHWSETRPASSARSSNRSSERKSVISDKSDEWIDLEDDDEYTNQDSAATPLTHNFAR
jgi:hypothetical protein